MEALVFALFAYFTAGIPVEYGVEIHRVATEDGGSPAELAAVLYSEHSSSRDYQPPYDSSGKGAVGLYQMVHTWRFWANDKFGWDITAEEFEQDPYASLLVASKLLLRIGRKHSEHEDAGHSKMSHWKCGETGRELLDEGRGDEVPHCKSSSERLERDIERFEETWADVQRWLWFVLLPPRGYLDGNT